MEKSKQKLLLNAEPFGFGPTAAIASFFPFLREKFEYIGYIGKNHTLELQKDLPYESIHDSSQLSDEEIKTIIGEYDIFLTALDFEMAALAKAAGKKIVIYDPLTWYWKFFPEVVSQSDMYLAQDFFGVKDRLEKEARLFPRNVKTVPPIVLAGQPETTKQFVLINLGGLQNPFWSVENVFRYAEVCVEAVRSCLPQNEEIVIATSNAVAQHLNDGKARSYSRVDMIENLKKAKYAFMTPGLGNIYDAAIFNIPTIWLPPANDSQGQQLILLGKHGMSDGQIDWSDFGKSIDYFEEQMVVLKEIKEAIYSMDDPKMLKTVTEDACRKITCKNSSSTSALLQIFGTGGAKKVGELIFEYCQSIE